MKILEVLCRRRITRSNLFFFAGIKYLTSNTRSIVLFNFKSRLYYSFIVASSSLNSVKRKIFPFRFRSKNINTRFAKYIVKRKIYLNRRFYFRIFKRVFGRFNRFYRPSRRYAKTKKTKLLKMNMLRYINYYKFIRRRFRFALQFFIFFKGPGGQKKSDAVRTQSKNFGESYLIRLYIQNRLKKNYKFKRRYKFRKDLNMPSLNASGLIIYSVRKFLSYRNFGRVYKSKNFTNRSTRRVPTNYL